MKRSQTSKNKTEKKASSRRSAERAVMRRGVFVFVSLLGLIGCGSGGLPPGGNYATLSGLVTDAATGAPIPGATITVLTVLTTTTTATGAYTLGNIPTGQLDGAVSAPNYRGQTIGGTSLAPGERRTLNIQLQHS